LGFPERQSGIFLNSNNSADINFSWIDMEEEEEKEKKGKSDS